MCNSRIFHNVTLEKTQLHAPVKQISVHSLLPDAQDHPYISSITTPKAYLFLILSVPTRIQESFLCNTSSFTYLFSYIYKVWENLSVGREKSQSKCAPSSLQQRREGGTLGSFPMSWLGGTHPIPKVTTELAETFSAAWTLGMHTQTGGE